MKIREGIIPAALGAVVTATGSTLLAKKVVPVLSAGIVGFGVAHVLLGGLDLLSGK